MGLQGAQVDLHHLVILTVRVRAQQRAGVLPGLICNTTELIKLVIIKEYKSLIYNFCNFYPQQTKYNFYKNLEEICVDAKELS